MTITIQHDRVSWFTEFIRLIVAHHNSHDRYVYQQRKEEKFMIYMFINKERRKI